MTKRFCDWCETPILHREDCWSFELRQRPPDDDAEFLWGGMDLCQTCANAAETALAAVRAKCRLVRCKKGQKAPKTENCRE